MTKRDVIKIADASFLERQRLNLEGHIVEFTPGELDVMGAITDDIPVSEEDFLEGEHDE
jgi:hypothetical protein